MVTNVRFMVKRPIEAAIYRWVLCIVTIAGATDLSATTGAELDDWMSPQQVRAMGLDKLSASQQQQLADWIEAQVAGASARGVEAGSSVASGEPSPKAPRVIEAHIVGDVSSWDGNARFTLDNGQVWAQRGSERGSAMLSSPAVVIEKNFFGFYVMTLVPSGHKIRVTRVR